jgi:hypothetical protein
MSSIDIRISYVFTEINQLDMFHFYFSQEKKEDGTLEVYAHRGWWNYGAEITFSGVLFLRCPRELDWNIRCRSATEEEAKQLRSQYDFSPEAAIYCFHDTSVYFGGRGVPDGVPVPPDLIQPQKSFVVAHSVKIVAFRTDNPIPIDWSNLWQKGDFYDLSEGRRKSLLQGPSTKRIAKKAAREAEKARKNNDPRW